MTEERDKSASQIAAEGIYQEVLDALSDAVMRVDMDVLKERIGLPFRMRTQAQEFIIETQDDWLASAKRFSENLKSMGVNHYIRLVTDAEFLSANYIQGRHVTHTLRNALAVVPSYENRATLTRKDGIWRISEMDSMIQNNRWPITFTKVDKNSVPAWTDDSPSADARRNSVAPKVIYQDYLDEMSRINMAHDFEGWCARCDFPHTVHMDQVDEVIESPEQIRPFFDMLSNEIRTHKIDRFERTTEHAEFLSATQICGYHQTNLYANGAVKLGPVASRYILTRTGTQWRMSSVTNSLSNSEFPYARPVPSELLVSLRDIQERTTRQ